MSKIMNQLYAEARATREAAATNRERPTDNVRNSAPAQASPSSIEWWRAQYERAGRTAVGKVAITAIGAIELPCSPRDHIDWWARTSADSAFRSALNTRRVGEG